MELLKETTRLSINGPSAVSFGKFDGLHTGHKLLMEQLLLKKKAGLQAVAFSFAAPFISSAGLQDAKVLTTDEEKFFVFSKTGIDYLVEYPFTDRVRKMEALDFLEKIVSELNVRSIIVGTDFCFGYRRKGDIRLLRSEAKRLGYSLEVVEKMKYGGEDISSTMIRGYVAGGRIEMANMLLGYPYFIRGRVAQGKQIGRTIGAPTANLVPPAEKLLPPCGGYATRVTVGGNVYGGITNIGRNPTVGDGNPIVVETHIFDFGQDIYGEEMNVEFLEYLRGEKKFASLDGLKQQIAGDIRYVKQKYGAGCSSTREK